MNTSDCCVEATGCWSSCIALRRFSSLLPVCRLSSGHIALCTTWTWHTLWVATIHIHTHSLLLSLHPYRYKDNLYSATYKLSRGANKFQSSRWNRRVFKRFKTLLVSVVSLVLSGQEFQAAGLKHHLPNLEFSSSATFDVVSSVGGPQTGSTTGFSDRLHRVNQVLWSTVHANCLIVHNAMHKRAFS